MTNEFLSALGIEGDTAAQIIAQAGTEVSDAVSRYGDYDDIKGQLDAANKQIEDFGKLDFEGMKKTADEYREKYESSVRESREKLEKLQFDHILDGRLSEMKARNTKAVKALLDMEGLKLNGGEIVGLKDQLDKIKADNDYLFESAEPVPRFSGSSSGGGTSADNTDARAVMGLAPLK